MDFPPWATGDAKQREYLIRLAALHRHPAGSIYDLSIAIGRSRPYLYRVIQTGKLTAEDALRIENASGGTVPARMLRPDLWAG